MITLYERVILTEDIPGTDLKKGDVGVVVEIYKAGEGHEVDFFASNGYTITVETLEAKQIRTATGSEILHTRNIEAA